MPVNDSSFTSVVAGQRLQQDTPLLNILRVRIVAQHEPDPRISFTLVQDPPDGVRHLGGLKTLGQTHRWVHRVRARSAPPLST